MLRTEVGVLFRLEGSIARSQDELFLHGLPHQFQGFHRELSVQGLLGQELDGFLVLLVLQLQSETRVFGVAS